jgi:hypothetical protein
VGADVTIVGQETLKAKATEADSTGDELSVTVTVGWNAPPAVGVPLIIPVAALMARPGGRPVIDHV